MSINQSKLPKLPIPYTVQLDNGTLSIFKKNTLIGNIVLGKLVNFQFRNKELVRGTPPIDIIFWDKFKNRIDELYFRTETHRFKVKKDKFDFFNIKIEDKYLLPAEHWDITIHNNKENNQLPI